MRLEESFLRDIVEHPDDDAPRLVFADWLQEQPDPERRARGEFIAVQLALEDDSRPKKERAALTKREKALLKEH